MAAADDVAEKRREALAKARAALASKRAGATNPPRKPATVALPDAWAPPRKPASAWWVWVLVALGVLAVLAVVALVIGDKASEEKATSEGLVPLKSTLPTPTSRAVVVVRPRRSYVTPGVLKAFYQAMSLLTPVGSIVRVLDASSADGGPLAGHKSHQKGLDVDISVKHMNLSETQELVDALKTSGASVVASTLPGLTGVTPWPGHDTHLHVRYPTL